MSWECRLQSCNLLQKEVNVGTNLLMQTGNDQTKTSSSLWSSSSLFMPGSSQVPGWDLHQLLPETRANCNKFSGLPSAAALMLPESLGPSDGPCGILQHLHPSVVEKVRIQMLVCFVAPVIQQVWLCIIP
jgi:hypothetical protein